MKKAPTFISFFSGIEGFRLGLEAAGWKCVYSVEIDDFCSRVQEARYGHKPQAPDISRIIGRSLPHADLWVAGWPCQGLSVAGLRKGLADERSGLFWEFVRLLEQKRPGGFLAENVPGLLTTCSCPLCSTFRCGKCKKKVHKPEVDDEEWAFVCESCGSTDLVGGVLPAHRGTDFFVVLSALQRVGYGVQTRILDAQYLGVPQRRRRIFFVGRLGAPGRPEVLFESEGGGGDPAAGGEEGKIAAGELARSLGAVGGGNDYGANKGTLVRPKRVASAVTASAGHHGHSSPRGDGTDNIVADKAATIGTNHKPDRGQRGENIVAGTLQSCSDKQGRKTPEVDQLVTPLVEASSKKAHTVSKGTGGGLGGRDGQDDYVLLRVDQTNSHPVIKKDKVTDSIATGTGHGGYANQAIARHEVFEPRFARNGRGAPDVVAPPLKAENGRTGKGDGAPCVVGPSVAAPLTAGSNPNSHMAGRRREDDQNIVAHPTAPTLRNDKQGQDAPVIAAADKAPCLDSTFSRTGRGRTEAKRLVTAKKMVAPCVTPIFERPGGETEAKRLVQQPLFIHTADAGANQNQVKKDGKADCLSEAQPGAVAFDPTGSTVDHGPSAPTLKAGSGGASGHHAAVAQPIRDPIGFHSTGGGAGISDKKLCPPITVGSGKDIPSPPAVAYDVRGMAQGGRSHAVETGTTGTVDTDGRNPSGNEAGTLVGPTPMSVRRLTPTECERLQGFPDGWTCLCGVRPDCPDRRIPPWLDPSTFKLGGCGHSACGCTCADSPRYKSLGNAVATCAVNWIGKRQIHTVGKAELKEVALG